MLRGIVQFSFQALVGAYGLSITSFLLLRLIFDEEVLFIALFNSFVHLLVLPALLLIFAAMLTRWRAGVLLLILPFMAAVWWYAPLFLPQSAPPVEGQPFRLMTYNLLGLNPNYDRVLALIRAGDADIVLLQEVGEEAAARIAQELDYPEQHFATFPGNPIGGMGILSRFPLSDYATWRTHFTQQQATIELGGQTITVLNVHALMPFPRSFSTRNQDIRTMLDFAATFDQPVILAGDFNMTPQSQIHQTVTGVYVDAFAQAGTGPGFTYHFFDLPAARIDYVFYDEHFTALDADVIPRTGGSDHAPVVVEFIIEG